MATVGNLSRRFNLDNNNKYITEILNLTPMLIINMNTNFAGSNVDKLKIKNALVSNLLKFCSNYF